MNTLTKTLLCGAALAALGAVPAVASNTPAPHVTALHAGRTVNKTGPQRHCHTFLSSCLTYTFAVSTSVTASDFRKTVPLIQTYYKWNTVADACSSPPEKLITPRKSQYARIRGATETYSLGCPSGPTVFYGDTYRLNDKSGAGQTDTFVSILKSQWKSGSRKYKGQLNLEVNVAIGN